MRLDQDLESFKSLPTKIQELTTLQDLASKTSGPENATINKQIQEKTTGGASRKSSKDARP